MAENLNIKLLYARIQKQLFYMIPEKWDKIYLYASIMQRLGKLETGEMFFYYFPKGMLKKKPVNCYEIPNRFNIEEETYLPLVNKLYNLIKELRVEFQKQGRRIWTSLTIKIEGTKFMVELCYNDEKVIEQEEIEAKHILWAYQNLKIPMNTFSKKQQKLLIAELEKKKSAKEDITIYTENMYQNHIKNMVQYHKEQTQYISEKDIALPEQVKTQILNVGV